MAFGFSRAFDAERMSQESQGLQLVATYPVQDKELIGVFAQRDEAAHAVIDDGLTYVHDQDGRISRFYFAFGDAGGKSLQTVRSVGQVHDVKYLHCLHQLNLGFFKLLTALSRLAIGKAWKVSCHDLATHSFVYQPDGLADYQFMVSMGSPLANGQMGITLNISTQVGVTVNFIHHFGVRPCLENEAEYQHCASVLANLLEDVAAYVHSNPTDPLGSDLFSSSQWQAHQIAKRRDADLAKAYSLALAGQPLAGDGVSFTAGVSRLMNRDNLYCQQHWHLPGGSHIFKFGQSSAEAPNAHTVYLQLGPDCQTIWRIGGGELTWEHDAREIDGNALSRQSDYHSDQVAMRHNLLATMLSLFNEWHKASRPFAIKSLTAEMSLDVVVQISEACCVQIELLETTRGRIMVQLHLREYRAVPGDGETVLHVDLYAQETFSGENRDLLQLLIPCINAFVSEMETFVAAMKAQDLNLTVIDEDLLVKLFKTWFVHQHPDHIIAKVVHPEEETVLHVEVSTEVNDFQSIDQSYTVSGFHRCRVFSIGNDTVVIYAEQDEHSQPQVNQNLTYRHIWEEGEEVCFLTHHANEPSDAILDNVRSADPLPDGVKLSERHQRVVDFLRFAEELFIHCAREGWEVDLEDLFVHQLNIHFSDPSEIGSERTCLSISFGTYSCVPGVVPHQLTLLRGDSDNDKTIQLFKMNFSAHDTPTARKTLAEQLVKLIQDWKAYALTYGEAGIPVSSLPKNFMGSTEWNTFFLVRHHCVYTPCFYGLINDSAVPAPLRPSSQLPTSMAMIARPAATRSVRAAAIVPVLSIIRTGEFTPSSGAFHTLIRDRDEAVANRLVSEDEIGPSPRRRRRTGPSPSPED